MSDFQLDPKFIAGIDLLRRSGMTQFRIGYTDDDDGPPIVWHSTATFKAGAEADAALDPVESVMRLCERCVDGGWCRHCKEHTIFVHDCLNFDQIVAEMGIESCVYAWDPELKTFRRGCE